VYSDVGESKTTFAKAYGRKARCYGEHVGEHIENLMGTHWELGKFYKKKNPPPTPLSAFLGLPIGSVKIFSSQKEFVTIFGLG